MKYQIKNQLAASAANEGKCRTWLLSTAMAAGIILANGSGAYALTPVGNLDTPTGGVVVGGVATFSTPAAGQLKVTQTTDRTVINWNTFNIGEKATTTFAQPSASSLAVNRVTGTGADPAQILGTLSANGQVMVLDRNGVLFGLHSKTNVGGIVAAAGDVSTSKVMSGSPTVTIQNMGTGATVENDGHITAADAGLVALVAPNVVNAGTITANIGKIGLGAGSKATVDLTGDGLISFGTNSTLSHALLNNSGKISAAGGIVKMSTSVAAGILDNAINNSGVVDVSSVTVQGGKIILAGNADVTDSGKLNANGAQTGGQVSISGHNVGISGEVNVKSTGDKGGKVSVAATSTADISGKMNASGQTGGGQVKVVGQNVNLDATGGINASAILNGNGGTVALAGTAGNTVAGSISAKGGSASGKGGKVTIATPNTFTGKVYVSAPAGLPGTFTH